MNRPSRRRLLAAIGAASAGGLAGCANRADRSPDGTDTDGTPTNGPRPTDDSAGTGTAAVGETLRVGDASVTLANPRVRRCVVARAGTARYPAVHDGQYVVLDATVEGSLPAGYDRRGLRGVADGTVVAEDLLLVAERHPSGGPQRDPSSWTDRPIAVPFPATTPDAASVQWRPDGGGDSAAT
ncbi:MAG: hypothetical protein ABEJ31_02825 [Haloarculaceae archaeon]